MFYFAARMLNRRAYEMIFIFFIPTKTVIEMVSLIGAIVSIISFIRDCRNERREV